MSAPIRLTVVLTHPIQYMSPWFRWIAAHCPELQVTVVYGANPTPEQQGVEFGSAISWDVDLLGGYAHRVLLPAVPGRSFGSESFTGIDSREVDAAIRATNPDAVLVPGWHSRLYLRAVAAARRRGVPVLYRGDTNLETGPRGLRRVVWTMRTRALLRLFDGYLSVGTRASEYLRHHGVVDPLIARSPAAVDVDFFEAGRRAMDAAARQALRAAWGATSADFVVLFAGKFVPRKRPADVIDAVARLEAPAVAVMAGAGPLEAALRERAAASGARVSWPGFLNQAAMRDALCAADCLVLPSGWGETWGLVVNESLASGTPAVVSEHVGCAPDLIVPGSTGETAPVGNSRALAAALDRVRTALQQGRISTEQCIARARTHSYAAATAGLVRGGQRVQAHRATSVRRNPGHPRVLALCGGMVYVSGVERMSFEALRVMRERGAAVHCIVNTWESDAIVARAEAIGASWSTGYYWYAIRATRSPRQAALMAWDVMRTSLGLLRDAAHFRPTHVLVTDYHTGVRNAPALALLRLFRTVVVHRVANAPEARRGKGLVWRLLLNPAVSRFVAISYFIQDELLAAGLPAAKVRVIRNMVPSRHEPWPAAPVPVPGRVIYIGQVIPPKGLDVLLEAIALLAARGHNVTLDVVGSLELWEGPEFLGYRQRIRERAGQPDLRDRVRLLGVREDVPGLLAAAAVHCMPTRPETQEALGNAVLEAKRGGVPSVVTRSGALPETVTHRVDGWVCDDFSAQALAEGLEYFLTDERVRAAAGVAARASAEDFAEPRFAEAWRAAFA